MLVFKNALTTMIAMSVMMMAPVYASADEATCRAVLSKCDSALKAEQQENALQKQIIKDQDERFKTVESQLSTQSIWKPLFIGSTIVIIAETLLLALKK